MNTNTQPKRNKNVGQLITMCPGGFDSKQKAIVKFLFEEL